MLEFFLGLAVGAFLAAAVASVFLLRLFALGDQSAGYVPTVEELQEAEKGDRTS